MMTTTDYTDGTDECETTMEDDLMHAELSRKIIGTVMKVLNELKPALDETLHENARVIELRKNGLGTEQQRNHPVHHDGHLIGTLVPDLIINEKVIVDPKVAAAFNETHVAQMLGYLNMTGPDRALLLNFTYAKLQWKRVLRDKSL